MLTDAPVDFDVVLGDFAGAQATAVCAEGGCGQSALRIILSANFSLIAVSRVAISVS